MLDSLRGLDWAPRSMRRRAREVEAAYIEAERTRGRANDSDVAAVMGISISKFHSILSDLRGLTITGFNSDEDDENGNAQHVTADPDQTPLALCERAEIQERLADAIDRLPRRERQVVALYYLEELTMREIGSVLGVTESRVSQIHTQAVVRLRACLTSMRHSAGLAL
jgi:RNA polymerase sigma factor for flagellar operon FliA